MVALQLIIGSAIAATLLVIPVYLYDKYFDQERN